MYVVGHKSPDTDSVAAAIALAYLKEQLGIKAKPGIQGSLNPESEFVLNKFNVETPEIITNGADKNIYLVDHSDKSQSLENIDKANIIGIVDHHKLGDITTRKPLEAWIWPVGCSCTVIKNMFDFYKVPIPQDIAGVMLSAILSDTVIFKSVTTTDDDRIAAEALGDIAGISDIKAFGMELFKKKSNIEGTSARELLERDAKDFKMGTKKVWIGQLEVIDLSLVDNIREELLNELKAKKDEGRDYALFLLTDIMKEGSELLAVGDNLGLIGKAFNVEIADNKAWLDGVMSRKKQVVPPLEQIFS